MNEETKLLGTDYPEIIFFNSDMQKEPLQELIDRINTVPVGVPIKLYFSTLGGSPVFTRFFIEFLNTRANDVTIYCFHSVISSGIDVLLYYNGQIVLTRELDYLLIHLENRDLPMHKQDIDGSILAKYTEQKHIEYLEDLKAFKLKPSQRKIIADRKDLYLYREDFHLLTKRKNIIIE